MAAAATNSLSRASAFRLPPLPTVRDLIRLYKLRALKQLSQNFLLEERITNRIVRESGNIRDAYVLEVGPGPGSITRSILKEFPKQLVVVEKDRRFLPTLDLLQSATKGIVNMNIVRGDILTFQMDEAFPPEARTDWEERSNIHLIGNLPFAISTRLLINWIRDISLRQGAWSYGRASMTLTFQKEVAERIVADLMDDQRCRLSLMSQLWTRPAVKFIIPGKAFVPKPDVDVGVVTLIPLKKPRTNLPFDLVEKVMRYIFSMRQKYVKRGVQNLFPPKVREDLTNVVFRNADIDPTLRSYQLSNEECLRIAQVYHRIIQEYPEVDKYNYRAQRDLRAEWNDWYYSDDNFDEIEGGQEGENGEAK